MKKSKRHKVDFKIWLTRLKMQHRACPLWIQMYSVAPLNQKRQPLRLPEPTLFFDFFVFYELSSLHFWKREKEVHQLNVDQMLMALMMKSYYISATIAPITFIKSQNYKSTFLLNTDNIFCTRRQTGRNKNSKYSTHTFSNTSFV